MSLETHFWTFNIEIKILISYFPDLYRLENSNAQKIFLNKSFLSLNA